MTRTTTLAGRKLLTALTVLTALVAVATPSGVATTGPADAAAAPRLLSIVKHAVYLSPNGDARRDTARVRFDLAKRADVVVRLSLDGHQLFSEPLRLGRLGVGRHSWTFDGRDGRGHLLRDDSYVVELTARRGHRRDKESARAVVRTTGDHGDLLVSRPTVYPMATVVDDRVVVEYLREGWTPDEAAYPDDAAWDPRIPLRVHLDVQDAQGGRVYSSTNRQDFTPLFTWDGSQEGQAVAAGLYIARVVVADAAGNRSSYRQTIRVSDGQLQAEVWSGAVGAGDAVTFYPPTPPSCNGCGEGCSPVPSTRFAGGLSFPPCMGFGYDAPTYAVFTIPLPFAAAPVDQFRVAATGGPTVPGSASFGELGGTQVGPGDATAWTPYVRVDLGATPYLTTRVSPVVWGFSTNTGNSYDVASFTVEYLHYVPVLGRSS